MNGGSGNDTLCGGSTSGTGQDSLIGGTNSDLLFEPSTSNPPTGSATFTSRCGSTLFTSGWAGSDCAYNLTVAPSGC